MKEEKYWILLSKKITGEATAGELELLEEMINNNPEWRFIMENLQELWNSKPVAPVSGSYQKKEDAYLIHINRLKEQAPDFKVYSQLPDDEVIPQPAFKRPFYKRWISYATVVVFIASVFVVYQVANKDGRKETASVKRPANEISINPGSRTRIQLPDGTRVWINSGSKLTYDNSFKGSTREVQLDGEAYFDVVKDAARPFIVHTSGIDIIVLGTSFNVKAYKTEPVIEATLIHGSIEVINKNRPGATGVMLKPHEKLIYNKFPVADTRDQRTDATTQTEPGAYSITIKPLNINTADGDIAETAWVNNRLVFSGETFEQVVQKMERWYGVSIVLKDEKLKTKKFTGVFENETIDQALSAIQLVTRFKYSYTNGQIIISK